jgi:hypothetical protein
MEKNVLTVKIVGLVINGILNHNAVLQLALLVHHIQNGMVKLVNVIKAIMLLVVVVLNVKKASNLMDLNVQEYQNLYNAIKLILYQSRVNAFAEMVLIYTMVIVFNVHILQFGMEIIVKVMLMLV